tara:strand:+ start:62 stop:274 length:213 start_codon:yes stop_codon:yes gene_type:complete
LAKEEKLIFEGVITDVMPNAMFKVSVDGHNVICVTGGRLRRARIRCLVGDKVKIETSGYDLTKGRIIFRL